MNSSTCSEGALSEHERGNQRDDLRFVTDSDCAGLVGGLSAIGIENRIRETIGLIVVHGHEDLAWTDGCGDEDFRTHAAALTFDEHVLGRSNVEGAGIARIDFDVGRLRSELSKD